MRKRSLLLLCAVAATGCQPTDRALSSEEHDAIVFSADSVTRSFLDAELAKDAERVIGHIAPEFYMYVDGFRSGYDSVTAQIRRTFPTLASFQSEFLDIEVVVLGRNGAVVSTRFRDALTDTSGVTFSMRGATTFAWERRGADWLMVYADADHYPDTTR